jgi:hypothetical protein
VAPRYGAAARKPTSKWQKWEIATATAKAASLTSLMDLQGVSCPGFATITSKASLVLGLHQKQQKQQQQHRQQCRYNQQQSGSLDAAFTACEYILQASYIAQHAKLQCAWLMPAGHVMRSSRQLPLSHW